MPAFEGPQNTLIKGLVTPKLAVAWSQRRAWHGDTVKILVTTEVVKDGAKIKLEIRPKDGKTFDTDDKSTITANKLEKDYKIDWADKSVPDSAKDFTIHATISDFKLTADSDPLAVDLVVPVFSA